MRIEQLQAFLAVAQTGNFGQAARQCQVSQSSVSRQIQVLESTLGLPLFHRSNQAKLTVAGEQFLPRARKICQEWETAVRDLTELREGKQPELCVAAIHSICAHYLPPVLHAFCRDYPKVQLRVTALGSDRALKVLRDGLVDIAIVMNNRLLTATPEMHVEPLFSEPVRILMAADHPLAGRSQVDWSDLCIYPQVVFKDGYGMQRLVHDLFANADCLLQIAMELNTLDAFRGVVRQGQYVALLPQSALVDALDDPELAVRSLHLPKAQGNESNGTHPLTRQVVLATTQDRLSVPPIARFCELVRQFSPVQAAVSPLDIALLSPLHSDR
ncbi:MAG: LysR family transcriptional regulator [Spirulinaceae cyanobacterium RM2_2_10]|nr:LysR family transcriptional regulator [Spirulinaceae cyanobacterium SM2_1_0]NJO21068.1 LysR family transcriptional regulator [Spirulinaceae cyanobacterium RM2_2_10]